MDRRDGRVIALLTDFGASDHYVASMKGTILGISPGASLVDITHEISPQDIRSAGFSLWACFRDFPGETVFVCVVDPGVGSGRRRILLRSGAWHFVAPDNGLLSFILDTEDCEVYALDDPAFFRDRVSGTFDGRDVFGPAAAHISNGADVLSSAVRIDDPVQIETGLAPGSPRAVIHVDRFGNLITNIRGQEIAAIREVEINGIRVRDKREYFDEGPEGGLFLMPGSTGLAEISSNGYSASEMTGAVAGEPITIDWSDGRFGQ